MKSFINIFLIFVTVFCLALGVFIYTSQPKTEPSITQSQQVSAQIPQQNPIPSKVTPNQLTVSSPIDMSVISNNSVKVTGSTKAGSIITITGGSEDTFGETNSEGIFIIEVKLKQGQNDLSIHAIDQNNKDLEKKISILSLD